MIGQRILHYQVTEKLGEGGMGVVYKAEDTKLDRTVALKFLNPDVLDSPSEQERLVNEARAAAGLHHPNICTIYEINEFDGQTFIAMAFVEGSTLRDRVLSDHIEIHEALRYLIQIADGLKQAHDKDIVHRDIKSANIMLNRAGQAVIMDFGLARRTGQTKKEERFSSGGTSAYMSPEQARGEGVDQRTDIWSLGVVLYEMLAGQLPFRGDYEQAVIYSILNESPKPVTEMRPGVPDDVVKIVDTCLAKEPDDRYQSLDELIGQLRIVLDRVTGGSRPGTKRPTTATSHRRRAAGLVAAAVLTLVAAFVTYDFIKGQLAGSQVRVPIAVIDFNNETGEGALDGLSGMLITALEQSQKLSVMTRTRMFDVLKTLGRDEVDHINESVGQEICRASSVGALVIPSIRKFGDLYTIDLKVLDTENNTYIFTTKQEGQGQESIPGMIDQIARDIRVDLREASQEVESTRDLAEVTTVNLDAYKHYFEGEEYLNDLDFKKAHESFEKAAELDSSFALAFYRLAYSEWWTRGQANAREHVAVAIKNLDRIPEKERYLVRALEAGLNGGFSAQTPIYLEMRKRYPTDKEMLFGLGDAEFHSFNYDSAAVHFQRVLDLDPEFDRALQHLSWTYYRTGRLKEAEETARRWVDVTESVEAYVYLASVQLSRGDNDASLATLEVAHQKHPDSYWLKQQKAEYYLVTGQSKLAIDEMYNVMMSDTSEHARLSAGRVLANQIYPYLGRFSDAEELYNQAAAAAASGLVDSTVLVLSELGRAELRYWTSDDPAECGALAEKTLGFPEQYKTQDYWKALAGCYMMAGNEEKMIEILETKIKDMHEVERNFYEVLRHAMMGRCDEGMTIIDSVLTPEVAQEARSVWMVMGKCLVESGNYDEAITALDHMFGGKHMRINDAPAVPPAYILLARAYEGKGNAERAVEYYRKALDIWKYGDKGIPMRMEAESRLEALLAAGSM